jgi:hypothetical protein
MIVFKLLQNMHLTALISVNGFSTLLINLQLPAVESAAKIPKAATLPKMDIKGMRPALFRMC